MEAIAVINSSKQTGMTLIEVMITLTIAVIIMSTTAPSLLSMIQNNRMVSLHNDLLADLAAARSTAVTRGNYATVCASNALGSQCIADATTWTNGWLVFDDIDNDGLLDANETLLTTNNSLPSKIKMIGSQPRISFDSEGSAFGFSGEFAFCDDRGAAAKKGLIVSNSGRSRVAESNEIAVNCP